MLKKLHLVSQVPTIMDVNSSDVMMELENGGNYKFYKCRGLTHDTGGTVCDTSERYEDCVNARPSLYYADESGQNNPNQFEPIIYFLSSENEYDREKESLVDSTTHLDDDEFNDYETNSNSSQAPETEVLRYFPDQRGTSCVSSYEQSYVEDENFEPYSFSSTEIEQSSDNDTLKVRVNGDFDSYHQPDDSRDEYYPPHTDEMQNNHHNSSDENILVIDDESCDQPNDQTNLNHPDDMNDDQEIYRTPTGCASKLEDETNQRLCNKRKQTYLVKEDLFSEVPKEEYCGVSGIVSSSLGDENGILWTINGKKLRTSVNWEGVTPFPNVKMSSILKGSRAQTSHSESDKNGQERESFSPAKSELFPLSHSSPNETSLLTEKLALEQSPASVLKNNHLQSDRIDSGKSKYRISPKKELTVNNGFSVYNNSSCNGQISVQSQKFAQYQSVSSVTSSIHMNRYEVITGYSEFNDDNYFNYVQPREIVVESNMDKLVSPTVDVDANTFMKTPKRNQLNGETKIDCNGNEVRDGNAKLTSSKSEPSASQTVEQQLNLRSAYAKQLGYENLFNTSNDSVIDEILFGEIILKSRLEMNFNKSSGFYSFNDSLNDRTLKISRSILGNSNYQRFGGYRESNVHKNNSVVTEQEAFAYRLKQSPHKFHPNLSFNFLNKSNSLGIDHQLKVTTVEKNLGFQSMCSQSADLKMKIKKENDEYRIDESKAGFGMLIKKEIIPQPEKTADGYVCNHCPEKLRTKKLLRKHVSDNHKVKPKKCSTIKREPNCPRTVTTYPCDRCDKVYRYLASLKKHQIKHSKSIK